MTDVENPDWLRRKYHDEGLTLAEIGDLVGHSASVVRNRMQKFGIERRKAAHHGSELDNELPDDAVEIIEGELLGDGCIRSSSESSRYAQFAYATSDENYRDWLAAALRKYGFAINTSEYDIEVGKKTKTFATKSYPCLENIRGKWYDSGDKQVPNDFELSPLVLRQWYIGDGSNSEGLRLYTNNFNKQSLEKLISELRRIGVVATSQVDHSLYISEKTRGAFFDYIAPLPEQVKQSYGYKWPQSQGGD